MAKYVVKTETAFTRRDNTIKCIMIVFDYVQMIVCLVDIVNTKYSIYFILFTTFWKIKLTTSNNIVNFHLFWYKANPKNILIYIKTIFVLKIIFYYIHFLTNRTKLCFQDNIFFNRSLFCLIKLYKFSAWIIIL